MVRQYRRYKNIDNQIRYLKPDGLQLSSPPDPLAVAVGAIPPVSAMISDPYDGHHDIQIHNGRCEEFLPTIADDSIDLIVTDPPYFKVKGDWWDHQWDRPEGSLAWMGELCDEWQRVLKPNGSLYVFASPQMSWHVEGEIRQRFNVLTNIRWRKPPFSTKAEMFDKDDLRSPFPASESVVFAEQFNSNEGAMSDAGYVSACESTKRSVIGDYLRSEFARANVTNKQVAALFPRPIPTSESDRGCTA